MIGKLRFLMAMAIALTCVAVVVAYYKLVWIRHPKVWQLNQYYFNGTSGLSHKDESRGIADRLKNFLNVSVVCDTLTIRLPYNFTIIPWNVGPEKTRNPALQYNDTRIIHSLVVFIKSKPEHFLQRKIARWTWAGLEFFDGLRLEVIFMIGRVGENSKKQILQESNKYGDILQIEADESYKNVIHKTVAGMQYASEKFPPNWFYASADDDMMPDLFSLKNNLWRMINSTKSEVSTAKTSNCTFKDCYPIFCGFGYNKNSLPRRNHKSKWYVSKETYPNEHYPSYCNGGWYTMSVKLAGELYLLSKTSNYFWIDDVWVTGFLRLKYFSRHVKRCFLNDIDVGLWTCNSRYLAFSHTGGEDDLMKQWAKYAAKIYEGTHVHVDQ